MIKHILIPGHNGYIGKNVYQHFLNQGLQVSTIPDKNVHYDAIIDCAFKGVRSADITNLRANIGLIYQLLQLNYDKFIYLSSGDMENYRINPNSGDYYIAKKVIYDLLIDRDNIHILNLYSCFGGMDINTRFIQKCITNYIKRQPIYINTNINIPMIYMKDLISLMEQIVNSKEVGKSIHVGYKPVLSYLQIAKYINTLSNYSVDIHIENSNIMDMSCEVNRLHKINGTLIQGIKDFYSRLL